MTTDPCAHEHIAVAFIDQTVGVDCTDCRELLAHCWADSHIPESLWNRLCTQDKGARPCEQSRDDVCAICGEPVRPSK